MLIKEDGDNLKIEYSDIKQINYSSICEQYIKNLHELIGLLVENKDDDNKLIGTFYNEFCKENDKRKKNDSFCSSRGKLLGCLKNSVNSYVIVIKGAKQGENRETTCCDSNLKDIDDKKLEKFKNKNDGTTAPTPQRASSDQPQLNIAAPPQLTRSTSAPIPETNKEADAIIVTKLFNLFNGTFEKLKYIFHHMELDLDPTAQAATAP